MKWCDLLEAEITLSNAILHLANRIGYMTAEGMAYPPGPEVDAIGMLSVLYKRTVHEREIRMQQSARRKGCAA
jgi:hypothetical protein